MGRPRPRSAHALLPAAKGQSEQPFLPEVGELYLVSTTAFTFGFRDPAADRRAVVIARPSEAASGGLIQVVTRTSDVTVPGIFHPADPSLRCDLDGVFSDFGSVEQHQWTPMNAERLGILPEPYLTDVQERFW